MEYSIHFAHITVFYFLIPVLIIITLIRYKFSRNVRYRYPLTTLLMRQGLASYHPHKKIIAGIRFITLVLLIILIAKPQLIDPQSKVNIEGIDIIVALDVSGSMSYPHHSEDERTRFEVAKQEAIHFIDKRTNDAIGVVIFGNDALSRCPLTVDKYILKQIIQDLELGVIDYSGTLIAASLITAANRLKHSKAASKIIILLTDGEPTENDTNPDQAIEIAKKLGIKIYTIGIGDNQEVFVRHPFFGVRSMKTVLNKQLLTKIAQETGGKFFEAKNAQDMRLIYDTIDSLEKTTIEAPIFTNYFDWFMPLLWGAFMLLVIEIVLSSLVWFSV